MIDKLQDEKNFSSFPNNIKQVIPRHCENCGHKYLNDNLKLIKKSDQAMLLHLQCNNCGHAYMINVVSPNTSVQGSSRIPINTDISSAAEIEKFAGRSPVSPDDVLDAHKLIKNLDKAEDLKKLTSIKE